MELNIVVVGLGEVGKHIATVLSREDHNVTVVDLNPEAISAVDERLDVRSVVGRGGSIGVLKEIEVDKADLLIAVTNIDEVNILTSLMAKDSGANKVIARVDSEEYLPGNRGSYQDLFGIDLVISPEILSAIEINKLIGFLGANFIANFADNQVELLQLTQKKKQGVTGTSLKNLKFPPELLVTAIIRNEKLIIPSGDTVLEEGDKVFIIGKTATIGKSAEFFANQKSSGAEKVVILGGGKIGYSVAKFLEGKKISVVVIEWNQKRCQFLSEQLAEALVINGDGTDIELLRREKVGEADVFVAASKRDEINLMSSLLAKELGCKKTIALVHRPDYVPVYEHLGLDATISPRRFAADQILRYVRSGEVVSVSDIELGKGEILEFVVPAGSKVIGNMLKDLRIPKGAVIGAIAGKQGVIIPTGNDIISVGDNVIVFTTPEVRPKVEELFKSR
ncbi:MAG: Trk system potassium transporter TrkA [Candidatus Zixiibacteriota bacterium]|nr:MAG: Trk system potassium transporter TrkA [candidate division Zixibacteria bacterium]